MCAYVFQVFDTWGDTQPVLYVYGWGACVFSSWGIWMCSLWEIKNEWAPFRLGPTVKGWGTGVCDPRNWGTAETEVVGFLGWAGSVKRKVWLSRIPQSPTLVISWIRMYCVLSILIQQMACCWDHPARMRLWRVRISLVVSPLSLSAPHMRSCWRWWPMPQLNWV